MAPQSSGPEASRPPRLLWLPWIAPEEVRALKKFSLTWEHVSPALGADGKIATTSQENTCQQRRECHVFASVTLPLF